MKDGLYQVTWNKPRLCAGFVVKDNKIVECAPILRRSIFFWQTKARWISE